MDLKERIQSLSQNYFEEAVKIRRHLHAHPELSFQEFETSKYIREQLSQKGISFTHGYAGTGILAIVKGNNPEKKTILLRGDMDALPIEEKNETDYRSRNEGVMHACGHDVHSTVLLITAFMLNDLKEHFEGTVKFLFQPGEEVLPGGASLMIKEGVLENPKVDKAFALHVFPSLQAGKCGFRPGMYMASTDELHLTVKGKGGHAAMPADYKNPLIIASDLLLRIDEKFMRNQNNTQAPTVVAFGKIEGKGATNVIPDEVTIEGTFRTMNEKWREHVHLELTSLCKEIAGKHQASVELNIMKGYPFLVNDETLTNRAIREAEQFLGKENIEMLPLRMTAEDFAYISQVVPSCFFRLGTAGADKTFSAGVHTPTFDIDEKALITGTGMMSWLAICELKQ